MMLQAQYIWIDGSTPTRRLRSKRKIFPQPQEKPFLGAREEDLRSLIQLEHFPDWGFDGSSTGQAEGNNSDCILKPVRVVPDPIRGDRAFLVLCEVFNGDGTPHVANTRHALAELVESSDVAKDSWFGFEQEYVLFVGSSPLGFGTDRRHPPPQGPYYCGVGSDEVSGRELVEDHAQACIDAGLFITGTNAEVMPGKWEFQVGGPAATPLIATDHLWLARWLLYRLGEEHEVNATLDPKPVTGDWNGSGMHTNFSTEPMRRSNQNDPGEVVGKEAIVAACKAIGERVEEHIPLYGDGIELRLTGKHETCSIHEFKYGVSDRTASIRIPRQVEMDGHGYLEDRRPNANADPYEVATALLKSTLGLW